MVTVRPNLALTRSRSRTSPQLIFIGGRNCAVGQHLVAFCGAGDADVLLHDVVKRSEIGVGDRPVIAVAIAAGGFEIVVAHAVALTAPDQRSPAEHAEPLPGKWLVGRRAVGILEIVDEPFVVVFHARVALLLDGPRAHDLRRMVAVLELVRGHVLGEFGRTDRAACFEQRDLEPGLGAVAWRPIRLWRPSPQPRRRTFAAEDLAPCNSGSFMIPFGMVAALVDAVRKVAVPAEFASCRSVSCSTQCRCAA